MTRPDSPIARLSPTNLFNNTGEFLISIDHVINKVGNKKNKTRGMRFDESQKKKLSKRAEERKKERKKKNNEES